MCASVVLVLVCGTPSWVFGQDTKAQKTWKFQGKDGDVEITLVPFDGTSGTRTASLDISSSSAASRSVVEEAGFLATVLDSLPKQGIDVQSLTSINFRLDEPEARSRVANYAALSKSWRPALRKGGNAIIYPLVTSFLNDSGAYREWDPIFRSHGLILKVVGVEKVIMEPFDRATTRCPADADCKNLLVPSDVLVQMNVYPITHR
jgi:hypothetical protein